MQEYIKVLFSDTENLGALFKLMNCFSTTYAGYREVTKNSKKELWLYWTKPSTLSSDGFIPFPFVMSSDKVADIVKGWLESLENKDIPQFSDGDSCPAYEVIAVDKCSPILDSDCDNSYVNVIIRQTWVYYGK